MLRKSLSIATALLLVLICGGLVGFSYETESNARFEALLIDVAEVDGMFFVDAAGVKSHILAHDSISGSFVSDVELHEVESWVREIPAVENVRVYPGLNRTLHVQVTQRKPLARLHTSPETPDLYIDSHGLPLPLSPYYTARVPIIHAESFEAAQSAFELVRATREHPLWSAFIDQITLTPEGALEIVPRIGSARILLGDLTHLEAKLAKLEVFYREQIKRGNLNAYKRINLTFHEQVVAQRYY